MCYSVSCCLRGHVGKPFLFCDLACDRTVSRSLSVRDIEHDLPYSQPEGRRLQGERRGGPGGFSLKIHVEPAFCIIKDRQVLLLVLFWQGGGKIFLPIEP